MADIIQIYENYGVKLQTSGNKYKAPCPFHNETAPSFFVYEDGSYHCFGCGAHGELDNFVYKFQGYTGKIKLLLKSIDCGGEIRYYLNMVDRYNEKVFQQVKDLSLAKKEVSWKKFDERVLDMLFDLHNNNISRIDYVMKLENLVQNIVEENNDQM